MKPHIPWAVNQTNPFNKDKFKGFNEKINDWDLERTVYIYEPQSLADLGDDATEIEYRKVWRKFSEGGHINIFLVPYREMPELKVSITSVGASWDDLDRQDAISGYTNKQIGNRPTKRFYSFEKLQPSEEAQDLNLYEESNLAETINNDGSFKQTTFTLNDFDAYEGGDDSYYRDVKLFYGIYKPDNSDFVQIDIDTPAVVGGVVLKGNKGNNITKVLSHNIYETESVRKLSFGKVDEATQKIVFPEENELFPQFLVEKKTENGIHFLTPWVWEYVYALEQYDGEYELSWSEGESFIGTGTDEDVNSPADVFNNGINLGTEYLYQKSTEPPYKHLSDREIAATREAFAFFAPYVLPFALPRGLSSHGTLYVESNSDATSLKSFNYTDDSASGMRAVNSSTGPWSTKTTLFALDYSYDPTIWRGAGKLDIFLSRIQYGDFYKSDRYVNLIDEIFEENPVYEGTSFKSTLGILSDIEGKEVDNDIREWNPDDEWTLALLPWDVIETGKNYSTNPTILDSPIALGYTEPKIKLDAVDFNPAALRTNSSRGFFGKYIDEDKVMEEYGNDKKTLLFKPTENDISQVELNYYAFGSGTITLKTFIEIDGNLVENYSTTYLNERAQGRNLSGGTIITFL